MTPAHDVADTTTPHNATSLTKPHSAVQIVNETPQKNMGQWIETA